MKELEKPLTPEEEKYYLLKLKEGDLSAQEVLIKKNMRLVAHMIKKYSSSDIEPEDMLSIGTIGLIKGIKSYNMDKGNRLVTYIAKCIDNELLMTLRGNKKRSKDVSINEPIGTDKEGNEIRLVDFLESPETNFCEKIEIKHDVLKLKELINQVLNDREREVIGLRYGFFDGIERTQIEISNIMRISRSYVSRIEKKALYKLRESYKEGNV